MDKIDLDKIIKQCEKGEYANIAQSGHVPCYAISEEYVIVPHQNIDYAKRFSELSKTLKSEEMKNIYTVVDYKVVGEKVYELQRRAKGKHFRIDSTKPDTRLNTQTVEYSELPDTRKDELIRRYQLLLQMPKQHIVDFFKAVLLLHNHKIEYDSSGNNLLYDEERGFGIIDLDDCSKHMPNLKANLKYMLDSYNYQTMTQLLGCDKIKQVSNTDKAEVLQMMKEALKKICVATFDLEYDSQKMTKEIMEQSLSTYKQYGIELTYDEIVEELKKSENTDKNRVNAEILTEKQEENKLSIEEEMKKWGQEENEASILEEMKKYSFEREADETIDIGLEQYLSSNPSTEQLSTFVENMIRKIFIEFANDTEVKDVKTRLDEFYMKIYTIKSNPTFQQITCRDDKGKQLYARVLSFLQTEQSPTGKDFIPSKNSQIVMSPEDLRKKDYDIRLKGLQQILDYYGTGIIPLGISDNFQTIYEKFQEQPGNTVSINLGRMNTLPAAYITRIFFDLGYRVNYEDVKKGGDITAQKIPLLMEKRENVKNGQQFGKESIGIYNEPYLSQEVMNKLQEYVQGLDYLEYEFLKKNGMEEEYFDDEWEEEL